MGRWARGVRDRSMDRSQALRGHNPSIPPAGSLPRPRPVPSRSRVMPFPLQLPILRHSLRSNNLRQVILNLSHNLHRHSNRMGTPPSLPLSRNPNLRPKSITPNHKRLHSRHPSQFLNLTPPSLHPRRLHRARSLNRTLKSRRLMDILSKPLRSHRNLNTRPNRNQDTPSLNPRRCLSNPSPRNRVRHNPQA
jgi:hypothetical protein